MKNDILRVLSQAGTVTILEYFETHKKAQYKDLRKTIPTHTLNARLRELRLLGLIEHHFVRNEKRQEWYTLTQKGEKIIDHIKKLENILKNTP